MVAKRETRSARVAERLEGDVLVLALAGVWRITDSRVSWRGPHRGTKPARVQIVAEEVERWDSSLLLFVFEVEQRCRELRLPCDTSGLPEKTRRLLSQLSASHETSVPAERSRNIFAVIGTATLELFRKTSALFQFVGEVVIGALRVFKNPRKFRWQDSLEEMQQCGAMAVPIVSLISFLVGVTLAYTGALVLRQYGGDIYVADLIGLATVREMGAMMTAVILAGRTGAAFAATLGNMKANEEVDALETLGISPVDFLVLPRMVALFLMMPLLALYADALGILGGMAVSWGVLSISPTAYWIETGTVVGIGDVSVGVVKAMSFGLIVGLAGCLRGLQAERSAAGVGRAATSAVVTSILLIIVADAVFAVLFNAIGL